MSSLASSNPAGDSPLTQPPSTDGVALELVIVQPIANADDATVTAQARTGGGLETHVAFPTLD